MANAVNWISVSERRPEASGEYLVVVPMPIRGYITIMPYSNRHRTFNARDFEDEPEHAIYGVTHWAELPALPKEEKHETV